MRRAQLLAGAVLLAALVAVAGCSSGGDDNPAGSNGDPSHAEGTVGAGGGTVEIDDEIALDVPAGALQADTDISIDENTNPSDPTPPHDFVSSAYTIEPSGTVFAQDATVTIDYDPSGLGRADEDDIIIYCDEGSGTWEELDTTVDEQANQASAEIGHLSDYAAMVDTTTSGTAEGIYAHLVVQRSLMTIPARDDSVLKTDYFWARFDSSYAPCEPIQPTRADTVTCNGIGLIWDAMASQHTYTNLFDPTFIELGANYEYRVDASRALPALVADVDFPDHEPYMTDPGYMDMVSLSGFTMTWESTGGSQNVFISIVPQGSIEGIVGVETANDGSHTFSSGDLSEVPSGTAAIVINYYNEVEIDEEGYDSRSVIIGKTTNSTLVFFMP